MNKNGRAGKVDLNRAVRLSNRLSGKKKPARVNRAGGLSITD